MTSPVGLAALLLTASPPPMRPGRLPLLVLLLAACDPASVELRADGGRGPKACQVWNLDVDRDGAAGDFVVCACDHEVRWAEAFDETDDPACP